MNWFKQEYSSWFIDNFVLQGARFKMTCISFVLALNALTLYNNSADGGLVACTPCDLTFVLLPMLETARGKVSCVNLEC